MCKEQQTQHDKYYVEPSEELKPAIALIVLALDLLVWRP